MEQEIGNISIALIRKLNPAMKGIGNDFIMDSTEYYIPDVNSIFKYPLRLDGIIIAVRKQGSATININLREYNTTKNDLILCAPGDILQSIPKPGMHQTQMFLISSDFLKEMYINLNSFMPFFISLKEQPIFSLTDEEVKELEAFYTLIEETIDRNDNFRTEIVRRLMSAYLYKLGSILHRRQPEFLSVNPKSMKREEILFNQFINLLTEHHRKERRVDFYAEQFVGVLSGNEKEYTKAINQLSYAVTQIENIIGENFKSLSDECASLSQTIDANGDNITTLQEALNAESQKRESAITDIKGSIADNMSDVQEKLEAYKKASQAYADDQSESNRTALEDAKQALQDSLSAYKGNLDSLSDTVDGLDNATQKKVADINQQIADALDALNAGDSSLDEKITQLSGSTTSLTDALQKAIDKEIQDRKDQIDQTKKELGDSINDQIKNVNDKMSEVEAAQKKYTDDASAENKQALAQAKTDLQAALDQLNQTLSGDISSLDADTQQKIANVKATIKTLDDQLKQDGTDITTLKNGVAGLTTNLSDVTKSIKNETTARQNADNAIKKTMGDSSDASRCSNRYVRT